MFAIDVGGSLAKIAYFSNIPVKKPHYADNKIVSSSSGRLHFAKFEARQLESCLNFIRLVIVNASLVQQATTLCSRLHLWLRRLSVLGGSNIVVEMSSRI